MDIAFRLRSLLRNLIERKIIDDNYVKLRKALSDMEIGLRVDLSIYANEYGEIKPGFRAG